MARILAYTSPARGHLFPLMLNRLMLESKVSSISIGRNQMHEQLSPLAWQHLWNVRQ